MYIHTVCTYIASSRGSSRERSRGHRSSSSEYGKDPEVTRRSFFDDDASVKDMLKPYPRFKVRPFS